MGGKAPIDGFHEPEIPPVHEQGDQARSSQRLQFASQNRIGRCIVHDHQFVGLPRLGREHAVDRLQGERAAAIDRHDDIDLCLPAVRRTVREEAREIHGRGIRRDVGSPPFFPAEPEPVSERLVPGEFDIRIEASIPSGREACSG